MPYTGPSDPKLPDHVAGRSEEDRARWVAIFNRVIEQDGDESEAMKAANAAVAEQEMTDRRFVDVGSALALREPLEGEPAPPDGGTIAEVPVLAAGKYHDPRYGDFEITPQNLDEAVANFKSGGREIALDYAHATEGGNASAQDQATAAGWIFSLVRRGPRHLVGLARLTKRAREMAEAEEIKYTSPVYSEKARAKSGANAGKPVGLRLKSVAFTPIPFLDDQPALAMSEATAEQIRRQWISAPAGTGTPRLPESQGDDSMALNSKAIEVLGLAEGFTDDDASAAIIALGEKSDSDTSGDGAPTDRERQLQDANANMVSRVAELESREVSRESAALVDGAIKDGKILAAKRDDWVERTRLIGVEPMAKILGDMHQHPLLSPAPGSASAPEIGDDTVATDTRSASDIIDHRARKLCDADSSLPYADACNRVLSDDPKLAAAYAGAEE